MVAVTQIRRCRTCLALGLSVSALVHGLAAGLMLHRTPLFAPVPQMRALELDLALFGALEGLVGEAMARDAPQVEPETAPPSGPEPKPGPDPEPEPEPKPEPVPRPEPEPEPESIVQPEAAPKPVLEARVVPPPKPVTKTKPRPRTEDKPTPRPSPKPVSGPKPEPKPRPEAGPRVPSRSSTPAKSAATPKGVPPSASKPGGTESGRSAGAASPAARASAERAYLGDLQRAIARHQRYPEDARRRHASGVTTLAFVVQGNGRIAEVQVARSSGDRSLDQAAVQAVKRLGSFKPIPPSIGRSSWPMRVPIEFELRRR